MALLDAEQVAQRLNLNPRTVKNLANRGELAGMMVANAWRFEEKDVEAYIEQQRQKTAEKIKQAKAKKVS
jgi:excisionase family DNA binding protein